jgi:hypothetical protein
MNEPVGKPCNSTTVGRLGRPRFPIEQLSFADGRVTVTDSGYVGSVLPRVGPGDGPGLRLRG